VFLLDDQGWVDYQASWFVDNQRGVIFVDVWEYLLWRIWGCASGFWDMQSPVVMLLLEADFCH